MYNCLVGPLFACVSANQVKKINSRRLVNALVNDCPARPPINTALRMPVPVPQPIDSPLRSYYKDAATRWRYRANSSAALHCGRLEKGGHMPLVPCAGSASAYHAQTVP